MRGKRVCRMHGGKGGAPRGERNGAYRFGHYGGPLHEAIRAANAKARKLRAMLAVFRAETRYERSAAVVRRSRERAADGTEVSITEVAYTGRRVWRPGGAARTERLLAAIAAAPDRPRPRRRASSAAGSGPASRACDNTRYPSVDFASRGGEQRHAVQADIGRLPP
jgi:hypothetical protein